MADFKVLAQRAPLPLHGARKTVSFELPAIEEMTEREIQRWEEECNITSDDLANDKVEEGAKRKHSFSEISSQTVLAAQPPQDRLSPPSHSQPSDDPTRDPHVVARLSFGQLQAEMWKAIRSRLEEETSDFRYCRHEFHPIFTRNTDMPATHTVVTKLIHEPLLVSTVELSQIFKLRQCTDETLPQHNAATIYYIRTFPIEKYKLASLITAWELANRRYDPVPHWVDFLRSVTRIEDSTIIYIRYIGMAGGRRTGWDRFEEDLKNRKSGILYAFMGTLVNEYPEVLEKAQVHEITRATFADVPPISRTIQDDRERVLIALFNRKILLNQQGGGYYPAYTPRASDHQLFASLRTRFFDDFARMVDTDVSQIYETRHLIKEWVGKVEEYAANNPIETRTTIFPLTKSYLENVIQKQAMPATIKGSTLIALFGKDVTLEDFKAENTFLSGSSRAGKLTVDMLGRIHQFEHSFAQVQVLPFIEGQFPFVDLYPWIGHLATKAALDLVREYFDSTKPRIIVTFSRTVSSWVASNFVHSYGMERFLSPSLLSLILKP